MRILVAEDESDIGTTYKVALDMRGHEVVITKDGTECLKEYKRENIKQNEIANASTEVPPRSSSSYFDVVILDYLMPRMNGIDVAKEILAINPEQRIIFASAYVKETLRDSVKNLSQVVELLQKPFDMSVLIETIEDKEAFKGLTKIMTSVREIKGLNDPTQEQLRNIFEGLRKLQKGRISWESPREGQ